MNLAILIALDMLRNALNILCVLVIVGCGQKPEENALEVVQLETMESSYFDSYPQRLSEWNFFEQPVHELRATEGVHAYEMNIPLFTDYAEKSRFFYLPDDSVITYIEEEVFDFPIGACLIKNFYYSNATDESSVVGNIIETRLLVHEASGWVALPYIWNEQQTDAILTIEGGKKDIQYADESGKTHQIEYAIPNVNQCKSCHMYDGEISPIGPSARQLNQFHQYGADSTLNQLLQFAKLELVTALPAYDQIPYIPNWENHDAALLDERARGYLDINCGHCHRPEGPGKTSGLDLRFGSQGYSLGILKRPVAAGKGTGGRHFDIYPRDPDNSILVYRMESNDPGEMMPELGRSMVHKEGVALIRQWIAQMEGSGEL